MKNLVDKIKKKDKVSLAKGITLIESEKKSIRITTKKIIKN